MEVRLSEVKCGAVRRRNENLGEMGIDVMGYGPQNKWAV